MVISCVLGSYVDGTYGYSRTKPPRCSTLTYVKEPLLTIQNYILYINKYTYLFFILISPSFNIMCVHRDDKNTRARRYPRIKSAMGS